MIEVKDKSDDQADPCTGCGGAKGKPIAVSTSCGFWVPRVATMDVWSGVSLTLCQECLRDLSNALGFFAAKLPKPASLAKRRPGARLRR